MPAVRLSRGRLRAMAGMAAAVAAGLITTASPASASPASASPATANAASASPAVARPALSAQGHLSDAHAAYMGLASVHRAAPAPPAAPREKSRAKLLAADRDLLVKVRLAGLWEMPAGEMAAEKGASRRVREIGEMIAAQHVQLDALVVNAANELDVKLPDEPNADQRKWLAEMEAASGKEFDRIFVDRLRAAHGKVFPVIADVRVGTRNAVVRRLAQRANDFVLTHLTLLESTDLVDYDSLPKPKAPATTRSSSGDDDRKQDGGSAPRAAGAPDVPAAENTRSTNSLSGAQPGGEQGGADLSVIWIILATSLVVGAIGTTRFVSPRWGGERHGGSARRAPGSYHAGPIDRPGMGEGYGYYDDYSYPRPVRRSRP